MRWSVFILFLTMAVSAAELPSVFVTANRDERIADKTPVSRSVITAEDIAASPARNLPDLLALEAGVGSRSLFGNQAARATIDLRGFGASGAQNTLILLDGRRLNDIDLAPIDYAAIPLNDILRVEILRGSGAVLYGDGAVGGSINIITKAASKAGLHGDASVSGGSYDTGELQGSAAYGSDSFALKLFGSRLESDGYRDNNEIEQTNGQADLRGFFGDSEVFAKLGVDDQELGLPGPRTVDPGLGLNQLEDDRSGTNNPLDFADQQGRLANLGLRTPVSSWGELILDGGWRSKEQQALLIFGGGFSSFVDTELNTWSFTPRLNTDSELFGLPGSGIIGVDLYYSDYDSDRKQARGDAAIHALSARQTNVSIYGQDTTDLTDTLAATLGLRLQHVELDARDQFDATAPGGDFGSEASPLSQEDTEYALEAGLRQALGESWSVFGRFTRSLRFATVDELFELNPEFTQVFSPLDPQIGEGVDLGVDFERGAWTASLGLYYIDLEDEIHFDPISFSNVNLDPTERYGAEFSLSWQALDTLQFKSSYTHTRSQFTDGPNDGNDVPLVPKHLINLAAIWNARDWLDLSATVRRVTRKRFDNDQANDFGELIPAYTFVDLGAALKWHAWRLATAVNNVTDEEAFEYGAASTFTPGRYNAFPLPERNFTITLGRYF